MRATRPTAAPARVPAGALIFAWSGAALFAASLLFFLYRYLIAFGRPALSGVEGPVLSGVEGPALSGVEGPGTLLTPIVIDVALFTAFALHHSVFARPAVKRRVAALLPAALERSLYTWVASALFLAVCAAWREVPGELYRFGGAIAAAGYTIQAIGVWLTAQSSARLDVLDLAGVRPVLNARGLKSPGPQGDESPDPDHVPLVTTGLYGFVRHPLYFAWALIVFGTPHMTATRLTFAIVSTLYLAIAIPLEEQALVRTFGARYHDYQKRVRWRMIPFLY